MDPYTGQSLEENFNDNFIHYKGVPFLNPTEYPKMRSTETEYFYEYIVPLTIYFHTRRMFEVNGSFSSCGLEIDETLIHRANFEHVSTPSIGCALDEKTGLTIIYGRQVLKFQKITKSMNEGFEVIENNETKTMIIRDQKINDSIDEAEAVCLATARILNYCIDSPEEMQIQIIKFIPVFQEKTMSETPVEVMREIRIPVKQSKSKKC
jgi:hypothetical protein